MAHCAQCHATFSTPANFDKHRKAVTKYKELIDVKCREPDDAGLVLNSRGIWRMPEERDFGEEMHGEE